MSLQLYSKWKNGFRQAFETQHEYFSPDAVLGPEVEVDPEQNTIANLRLDRVRDRELNGIKEAYDELTSLFSLEEVQEDTEQRIKDTMQLFKDRINDYLKTPRSPKDMSFRTVQRMASRLELLEDIMEYTTDEDTLENIPDINRELTANYNIMRPFRNENAYMAAWEANENLQNAIDMNRVLKNEKFMALAEDPEFQDYFAKENITDPITKATIVTEEKYAYASKQVELLEKTIKNLTERAEEAASEYQGLENSKEMLEEADAQIKESLHEVETLDERYLRSNKISAMMYQKGANDSLEVRRLKKEVDDLENEHRGYEKALLDLDVDLINDLHGEYKGKDKGEDFANRAKEIGFKDYEVKEKLFEKEQELSKKRAESKNADERFDALQEGFKKTCDFIGQKEANIKNKVNQELKTQKDYLLALKKELSEKQALLTQYKNEAKKHQQILAEVKAIVDNYKAAYPKEPGDDVNKAQERVAQIHNHLVHRSLDAGTRSDLLKERMQQKYDRWFQKFNAVSYEKTFGNTDEFNRMKEAAEDLNRAFKDPLGSDDEIRAAFAELVVRAENYSRRKKKANRGTDLGQMRIDLAYEMIESQDVYMEAFAKADKLATHYTDVKKYATDIAESVDVDSTIDTIREHKRNLPDVKTDKNAIENKVYADKKSVVDGYQIPKHEVKDPDMKAFIEVNSSDDFDKDVSAKNYAKNVTNLLEKELYNVGEKQGFYDKKMQEMKTQETKKEKAKADREKRITENENKRKNKVRKI